MQKHHTYFKKINKLYHFYKDIPTVISILGYISLLADIDILFATYLGLVPTTDL
jgi:hypothetical protein